LNAVAAVDGAGEAAWLATAEGAGVGVGAALGAVEGEGVAPLEQALATIAAAAIIASRL